MAIPWRNLHSITAREIINSLYRDGFVLRNSAGSHQRFRHPDGRRVTVTFHSPGQTFGLGLLQRMFRDQAHWTEEDLRRLGLL
ncbi:MAG: hypothetical protein BZY80_03835 [SAR202 cluster bacterium Io17-Chloro-G2]|nr:MAG: hypothetical protein BZY80_03835 [SAR202 cluster bacterium Io17-Chloro-G2]